MSTASGETSAALRVEQGLGGVLTLALEGHLDSRTAGEIWRKAQRALSGPSDLVVDASGLRYCDLSGIGLLVDLRRHQQEAGKQFEISGLAKEFQRLLDLFDAEAFSKKVSDRPPSLSIPVEVGRAASQVWEDIYEMIAFTGSLISNLGRILVHRQRIRWGDTILVAESAGLNALPIICLMGLILGLIIAFQGAVPLKRYGGEILVADMVVISFFREIGPLFTAIMLAGRSSSAFAAELGTMKVNEEVDALETMGLDSVSFLAVPRVIAGVVTAPLLTIFMNLTGLIGGWFVFIGLGFPTVTYLSRILDKGSAVDLSSGLFRSLIFGIIVAGMGCLQGLRTGTGARAVGESTTRAVVSTITMVILADGVIAIVFFAIGL